MAGVRHALPEKTGTIDFRVESETYQTWYKVVGELKPGSRPLVALNGGPGAPHQAFLTHIELVTSCNIPIIFYDQLGSGNSTHLREKGKEFWTIELFMDELDNLLAHFNVADGFDLIGQSWGGMLGSQYAAHRQPMGLKRLILANTPASIPLWEKALGQLLSAWPEEERLMFKRHEDAGTTDSEEFQAGLMKFYQKHLCRLDPWPKELMESFGGLMADPTVYHSMQGPSEFTILGTLKHWSIIEDLHKIECSTLLINGAFDEAQDVCVAPFFERIRKVKWVQFANSSHFPAMEERERYMRIVGDFLKTPV